MNFLHLKYFLAVCEFGTVSAAAEYLHIAQPSVSLAIKELENEFGARLFHRAHKGMRQTPEGELLFKLGKDILEKTEAAEKIMKDVGQDKKTLKIGVPPMIGSLILPALYNDFLKQTPNITLDIVECGTEETLKLLASDRLDAAFISHSTVPDADLDYLHIDTLEIVCGVARENPLESRGALTPRALAEVPLVMYGDSFFQSNEIKKWFSSARVTPNILLKTNQLSTIIKIISSDTAVGFLFKKLTNSEHGITAVPLDPPITADISLVWKKKNYPFSGLTGLKTFLKGAQLFA